MVASKRMIDVNLVDSDNFLEMPLTTQALYFHLCVRTEDYGFINNPKKIQRMIGASDDDLKLLIAKEYVIPFESGIIVIKHWHLHNSGLRKDRFKDIAYLKEYKQLFLNKNKIYEKIGSCLTDDGQATDKCQHKIREDKIREDKISNISKTPYQEIINLYNEICVKLPQVMKITDNRKKTIKARFKEYNEDISVFKELFHKVNSSDFLCGVNTNWKANFDWLMNQQNMTKVLEDRYKNKEVKNKHSEELVDYGPIIEVDDGNRF